MKTIFQLVTIVLALIFLSTKLGFAETNKKKSEYQKNLSLSTMKKKESIKLIKDSIDKINNDCCEANFVMQRRIDEIKNNLEKCLLEKCYDSYKIIFTLPNPKITALKQTDEVNTLLIENDKQKYENISKQNEIENQIKLQKTQNEKNIQVLKATINEMSKENNKLKKTVDKMLLNYQKKIINLENENKKLKNKFNTAYEMLPKRNKKKIDELVFE